MEIRPMTAADLTGVRAVSESVQWGDLTPHFAFYLTHPAYRPLVAEVDGQVAGTGVAICRGAVGWVGMITVLPAHRSHGLGRALTVRVLDELEQQGCRTQVLLATEMGRPLYEQLGFTAEGDYAILSGPSLHAVPRHARLRPMAPADLPAVYALDRAATGEDRSAEIEAWRANGWVMTDAQTGAVSAYHVRPGWGAGPVVAADPEDGRTLVNMV
ncbi:MAG TPA: GNAT family N-acetyltransferase, partial [Symbiobacteriaceae bacterium]|nr:GNAT family N-acetyltransferase [Symbiobacteriaceae bacterium]